jgi:hypothetical protein
MTWHFASLAGAPYLRQTDRTILNADPSLSGLITLDGLGSRADRLTGINTDQPLAGWLIMSASGAQETTGPVAQTATLPIVELAFLLRLAGASG